MDSVTQKQAPIESTQGRTLLDAIVRRSSIRRTLLVILAIALLPLLALAAWQAVAGLEREHAATQSRLTDRAEIIAGSALNPVAATAALLDMVAANAQVRSAVQPDCSLALGAVGAAFPHVTGIAVHTADGMIACASNPAAARDLAPLMQPEAEVTAAPLRVRAMVVPANAGVPAGTMILKLRLADGTKVGAMIDPGWLQQQSGTLDGKTRYAASIIDADGQILASSQPMDWDRIILPAAPGRSAKDDASGRLWLHGAATLFDGATPAQSLRLVLSQPQPRPFDAAWLFNVSFVLLPLFALLLASLAIWIGADRSILRWVRNIGAVADEIGRGTRVPNDERFSQAPTEIRALAAQMKRVAKSIAERDQGLRRAAEQERLSALELHHRLRNNLQVIGSWLALERGMLPAGMAGNAFDRVTVRVAAISLVHRLLYDVEGLKLAGPSVLVAQMCPLLERHGLGQPVSCDVAEIAAPIGIDCAVPLALWMVEAALALQNDAVPAAMLVQLLDEGDVVQVAVATAKPGVADHWLGLRPPAMLHAIGRQLSGITETMAQSSANAASGYSLSFPHSIIGGTPAFSAE